MTDNIDTGVGFAFTLGAALHVGMGGSPFAAAPFTAVGAYVMLAKPIRTVIDRTR